MNILQPYIFKLIEVKMLSKFLKTKPEQKPTQEYKDFLERNIRRIERGLRNFGFSRVEAMQICRFLREAIDDGEIY